jgi:hypothetical protein
MELAQLGIQFLVENHKVCNVLIIGRVFLIISKMDMLAMIGG